MPPKDPIKKVTPNAIRIRISDASLLYVPEDAVEGYQERIETGIDWTLVEAGARYHKQLCCRNDIPDVSFFDALQNKIKQSIFKQFIDEDSISTLNEQWETLLPLTLWDIENCANEQGKICFHSINCITDNMNEIIKSTVSEGDRKFLMQKLKMVHVLRVNDCKMTELDEGLTEFKKLVTLNLCGNYISNVNATFLPPGLRTLELQANRIRNVELFAEFLPTDLLYLGLARNFLNNEGVGAFGRLPHHITVLDFSDNDIYELIPVLDALTRLPSLVALLLAGNPCSVCAAYARVTISRLPRLRWLDSRQILPVDRTGDTYEPHPDDLRSSYFNFTIFRIMSVPVPPKVDKGAIATFHVELELPLLDSARRTFLMFRRQESLVEMLPPPEEDEENNISKATSSGQNSKTFLEDETGSEESDIYAHPTKKNPLEIRHYTTFVSNKVPWKELMNFQEPAVRIFCPDLVALRDTFRTIVTLKLIYTLAIPQSKAKPDKKSTNAFKLPPPGDQTVTVATIKCSLRRPDWSQQSQHFHWDDSLDTDEAIHWGDGDLSVLQYSQAAVKMGKPKGDIDIGSAKQVIPDNLTCQFGFGIDTLHA